MSGSPRFCSFSSIVIQTAHSRHFSCTLSIHQWDNHAGLILESKSGFIIFWFKNLGHLLSLNLIFLICKTGIIIPSGIWLCSSWKWGKFARNAHNLFSATYVTVTWLVPEHMMKEVIRQSLSPHIPLFQPTKAAKISQRSLVQRSMWDAKSLF